MKGLKEGEAPVGGLEWGREMEEVMEGMCEMSAELEGVGEELEGVKGELHWKGKTDWMFLGPHPGPP